MDISEEYLLQVILDCQVAAKKDKVIQTVLTQLGQIQNRVELLNDIFKANIGSRHIGRAIHCLQVERNYNL